jgi:hypothetical protein
MGCNLLFDITVGIFKVLFIDIPLQDGPFIAACLGVTGDICIAPYLYSLIEGAFFDGNLRGTRRTLKTVLHSY